MKCRTFPIPGGGATIVCSGGRARRCCQCGREGSRLCDWKKGGGASCDASICAECTHEPAPGKDLCPKHAAEWLGRRSKARV